MLPTTNAHLHLELTGLAHLCPSEPVSFVPWIRRLVWEKQRQSEAQIRAGIEKGIAVLEHYGTTHIGEITATGWSVEPLYHSRLKGVVYLEILGLDGKEALGRLEQKKGEINRLRRRPRKRKLQIGLSLHAPYSCHPDLLRQAADWCRREEVPLCLHVAESPEETEYLTEGKIPGRSWGLRLLGKAFGFGSPSIPGLRPVPYLASLGVLEARPLLAQAVQVNDEDIKMIAEAGCGVVHCPRSNHFLSCGRMPLERYLAAQVPVYLGTDSLASSPSLDIRQEVVFAQALHIGRVDDKAIEELIHRIM